MFYDSMLLGYHVSAEVEDFSFAVANNEHKSIGQEH